MKFKTILLILSFLFVSSHGHANPIDATIDAMYEYECQNGNQYACAQLQLNRQCRSGNEDACISSTLVSACIDGYQEACAVFGSLIGILIGSTKIVCKS